MGHPRAVDPAVRLVADAIPLLFSYVDRDERYRFNNVAYADWFGAPADRLAGRHVREVLGDEAYVLLRGRIHEALAGEAVRFEREVPFRRAGRRYVSVTYAPDRDESGKVHGFYSLIQDQTGMRRRELELRDAIAREAFAEHSERRVLAKELDDEFGQMLSLVSMKLEALREAEPSNQSELLREITQLVRATRGRAASLSYHLGPSMLFDVGVVAAAEWLAEELKRRDGVRVDVHSQGELEALDDAGRIILFRALHGLLSRVEGGDRAPAHVRIEREGSWARLEVSGVTLPPGEEEETAVLGATRTLAERLGGGLTFQGAESAPKSVRIELPIRSGLFPEGDRR